MIQPSAFRLFFRFISARRAGGLAIAAGLALLLPACASHGVSLRKNGATLTPLTDDSGLLPQANIAQVISPLDKIRVQILPTASTGAGLVLEPYDTIKYEFNFRGEDYHILPGDELSVHFGADPKRDLSLVVRPDGKVTLPNAGEITALGKTPMQLAADINAAYQGQLNEPAATVSFARSSFSLSDLAGETVVQDDGTVSIPKVGRTKAAGLTIEKLDEDLSALASKRLQASFSAEVTRQLPTVDKQKEGLVGFDESLMVSADGRVALPEIGAFTVAGKTTADVQAEIAEAVRIWYKNLTVLVGIEASDARVVYVDGEVNRPGAYPLAPGMTLLRAVTLAGGTLDTGDMSRVTLIHRDNQNDVSVYITNLKEFIAEGARENDLALSPQDIVVVPKTAIARVDLWVDQYITRALPFSRSVGYIYTQGTSSTTTSIAP